MRGVLTFDMVGLVDAAFESCLENTAGREGCKNCGEVTVCDMTTL